MVEHFPGEANRTEFVSKKNLCSAGSVECKLVYTVNRRKAGKLIPEGRGNGMRSKTRFTLAILLMIFASASARAQVEKAAGRANRPL